MPTRAQYPLIVSTPICPRGGEIPARPFAPDRRLTVKCAPSKDDVLRVLERVTPDDYHQAVINDTRGSIAVYRAMACQAAVVAQATFRSQQSLFWLPYPTQGDPPASSLRSATMAVDLRRTKDLDQGRIVEIAAMTLAGPQGRTYINAERVEWFPFDSEIKTVEFVSENPGYVGNLDFLADANGRLHEADGTPSLEIVDIASQGGRSGTNASLVATTGQSKIQDSGQPDQFIVDDVGLYVEITGAGQAENRGRLLKIVAFEDPGTESPPGSGLLPHLITVDDAAQRTQVFVAHADDGGVFTNETTEARSTDDDDVTLLPAAVAVSDAYYIGGTKPFGEVEFDVSTFGAGDWVIVWEYWNGSAWSALGAVVDATSGFMVGGVNRVTFPIPLDWASTTVNAVNAHYIRARVTSVTTTTTQPLGRRVMIFVADPITAEISGASGSNIESAQADDGGAFTDETLAARDAVVDDMTLLPATAAVGDAYYFGAAEPFDFFEIEVSTAGDGDWTLAWEYWTGSVWSTLTNAIDQTNGFRVAALRRVQWQRPDDWASTSVNAVAAYYVRARVTAVTTTTTQPLGQTCRTFVDNTVSWAIRDWRSLGIVIDAMDAPAGGVDDTLRLLGEERGLFQQAGESDAQFRQRGARLADVVTPAAIQRAVNRELAPLNFRGVVIDLSNGFDGLFMDLDFLDYYEPGDPADAPSSPYKLLLDSTEVYGWFWVYVPILNTGFDSSCAWDDGPTFVIDGNQLAGAWDVGIWDGFDPDADAAYRAIWDAVDSIRAGGVGFTMIRTTDLNDPVCP